MKVVCQPYIDANAEYVGCAGFRLLVLWFFKPTLMNFTAKNI